jgi:hypothetical protein
MRKALISLAVLALIVGVASAKQAAYQPRDVKELGRFDTVFWFDDVESGEGGWQHGDYTATAVPHFHVDSYMAYAGQYSWWCGTFAYDADGGYGNGWDDRLTCPPQNWTGYTYPVITFAFRGDSEPGYDFTYVQAESSGAYINLNRGYDGPHSWGVTGFYLGAMDNPAQCRFRFVSDGAWSDGDGLYPSNAGACMFDEIQIYDYTTGTVLFYDDVESGGLCTPGLPAAAGDYWHIRDIAAEAWSPTHHWCNSDVASGETFVPPGVANWLRTPTVNLSAAQTCTTYFVVQFFTPTVDNDYWTETMYMDGVGTQLHAWWGDQCDSGYTSADHFGGIADDVTSLLPATLGYHEWEYHTTDNGAGPDVCNHAGITLDDIGFYGQPQASPVEQSSWGRVKALWRR